MYALMTIQGFTRALRVITCLETKQVFYIADDVCRMCSYESVLECASVTGQHVDAYASSEMHNRLGIGIRRPLYSAATFLRIAHASIVLINEAALQGASTDSE